MRPHPDEEEMDRSPERDHARLMVTRLPLLGAGWLASDVAWLTVLGTTNRLAILPGVLTIVVQAAVIAMALVACRSARSPLRPVHVAALTCVALGVSSIALFAVLDAHLEVLAFVLLTLYLLAALLFAWGWRLELLVLGGTLLPGMLAGSHFRLFLPVSQTVTAIVIGAVLCLAIAEGTARAFRAEQARRRSEREMTRALAESRDAYRDLAENQRDMLWAADLSGRFTYVNGPLARLLGETPASLIGKSALDYSESHPDNPDFSAAVATLVSGETLPAQEILVRTLDGLRWFEAVALAVRDGDGRVVGMRGISRDVTERRHAQERLRESESRYRGLLESQHDLIVRLDLGGRFTFVNDAYCVKMGRCRADLLGQGFLPLVHPEDHAQVAAGVERMRTAPHRIHIEIRNLTTDGPRWISWEGSAIADEQGRFVEVQAVGRDVTERHTAEEGLRASLEDLRRSEENLRLLAQRQVMVREEERKRLGFDLHDDVCQELVGVGIMVESVRRRLGPIPAEAAADLTRVSRCLAEVVEHLRLLARDMRPLLLRDLGLEGSLHSLAAGMSSGDTSVVAQFTTAIPRLEEDAELAVYRIAQEALTNATRHACARSIVVTLAAEERVLHLEVRDDGRGFDATRSRAEALGLVSMKERALALGGRLELWSEPGKGTRVRLECPLVERAPASAA